LVLALPPLVYLQMQLKLTGKFPFYNQRRLQELLNGDGIAIVEAGLSFGGGGLQNFGLNSNTSANGFIKCLYKKVKLAEAPKAKLDEAKLKEI
jgi:hypothetical protein